MSRINTNISSMVATRILGAQNRSLTTSLDRLSTGLRINTGKDDPAGLIASELLRSEKVAIGAALTNIARANNVVASAEGGLDEINKLMTELEDLIDRSANEAGISDDERDANQLQIDSILESINRIAVSTEFQGKKLLAGGLDYTTSGVSAPHFDDVNILSSRFTNGTTQQVIVQVTTSAQRAGLVYAASATGAGTTVIQLQGRLGTEILTFGPAMGIAQVATAVNQARDLTGVSATVTSATGLTFNSIGYGSKEFVSVKALTGTFNVIGGIAADRDEGVDAGVRINGNLASSDGLRARVTTSTLVADLRLTETFGTTPGTTTFLVTGGGADFAISPTINLNGLASLGVRSVSTSNLGRDDVGFLSSLASGQANAVDTKNFTAAQKVIRTAQTQVSQLRGRLGAFQKDTLGSTASALTITLENTTAAESAIRDTDFASETSNLTRAQILVQSATSVLRLANQAPQAILALLQ
jgi:flagellin